MSAFEDTVVAAGVGVTTYGELREHANRLLTTPTETILLGIALDPVQAVGAYRGLALLLNELLNELERLHGERTGASS